ncbi:putative oxidoreductase [Aspergillus steynii IBT 23096]|uniref:Putative oxidoreductase n=1 Tax=Aspergillus steynii IBT 23096 TaxID=1392250 RepID=A0A2I2FWD8_9EURO|nr:putative oxidoreductase [Aspergillus steynii IBT 23096]PLB44959.1 putative oxidoreductase [Aspergillus steynii IBT 23096]
MSTVILGGGIIGSSIAYYLSESKQAGDVHIIESSSQLFSGASGYAAGFLAKDWFAPSLASLGELSFNLHESLATEHGGAEKWGYMKGTALSLAPPVSSKFGVHGDDWLSAGASRAEMAGGSNESATVEVPEWLTRQKGLALEKISDEDTAQVDPFKLSAFLIDSAISRGVQLHQPARAISLVTDQESDPITEITIQNVESGTETTIPCTNLIVCAGPWTPRVFHDLFPSSQLDIPVSSLAGYSLVLRSPRYTLDDEQKLHEGRSHAIFSENPGSSGFSPEVFSRQGAEIYIAGLNSPQTKLPPRAEDTVNLKQQKDLERLKSVSIQLLGRLTDEAAESGEGSPNIDDLEVVREGLCFRPISRLGVPIVSRVGDSSLGRGFKSSHEGGVFVASGHGPWGISLSLGTGKVIADMVRGVEPGANVNDLSI